MTVLGGIVTAFGWSFEQAGLYSVLNTTDFFAVVYNDLWWFYPPSTPVDEMHALGLKGSVSFGTPQRVDPLSTA